MDPVNFTASLLTLLHGASVVWKIAARLREGLRDAPHELASISTRVLLAQSQLTILLKIYEKQCTLGNNDDLILSIEDLAPLQVSLALTKEYCHGLEQAALSRQSSLKRLEALKWVFRDKRLVTELIGHLEDVENALRTLLLALSV
jgi:hypothetical protein